jgi:cellulose synthase/poly-beta-1,6-N-acetylglucosamine synthase-like glycosyltransferase
MKRGAETRVRHLLPSAASGAPTVTVVVPCHNYALYLRQAVESVLSQPRVRVDVVVVDDRSTDDSLAVAHALERADPRVRVLANAENLGPVATFNRGLAAATGEFLVRLDADDLLTPGSLQRSVAVMQAHPNVGLVYGHPLHFEGSGLPTPRTKATRWLLWDGLAWLRLRCEGGNNVITSPEVLMRASVVTKVGGQQPLAHTHDMEMWLRISAFSDVAYIQGADQAFHREHPASLSMSNRDPVTERARRLEAFETLFAGLAGALPDAQQLRLTARRALASDALLDACHLYDRGRPEALQVSARLADFARSCDSSVSDGPFGRALRLQQASGPLRAARSPFGQLRAVRRGLRFRNAMRRWRRTGVYERI